MKKIIPSFLVLLAVISACTLTRNQFAQTEHSDTLPPASPFESVWVMTERPLTAAQLDALHAADSLLIMIPGVTSGDLSDRCEFLDNVRRKAGCDLALFYDWEAGSFLRRIVSRSAVTSASRHLIDLCETFQNSAEEGKTIGILAHSAGTVVVNRAAMEIVNSKSSVRFGNVLLVGTALDADEPLTSLKDVSDNVLNICSQFDKVNRQINDNLGWLKALDTASHCNLRMDYSLSGRIMRHLVSTYSNPENWDLYGTFLSTGHFSEPHYTLPENTPTSHDLLRLTLWVKEHPEDSYGELKPMLPKLLRAPDPEIKYYSVILAGLLKMDTLAPALKSILDDNDSPLYLRIEVYQALANLEDGHQIEFLRHAHESDPSCAEEIRDALRELKRKRIEAAE